MRGSLFWISVIASSLACGAQRQLDWVVSLGSNGFEGAYAVAVDASNNVYLAGQFHNTVDFDPGPGVTEFTGTPQDPFVAKYTAAGDLVWARHFVGPGRVTDIAVDGSDNLVVTGWFGQQPLVLDDMITLEVEAGRDPFFAKLDANGNVLWGRVIEGSADEDRPQALAIDSNNAIIISGQIGFRADLDPGPGVFEVMRNMGAFSSFVAKYDSSGNFVWGMLFEQQTQTGRGFENSLGGLVVDANDDIYAAGEYVAQGAFGAITLISQSSDGVIVKISSGGSVVWAQSTDGPGLRAGNFALDQDGDGNLYTTGIYLGEKDFDPNPTVEELSDASVSLDLFIASYDENGNFRWLNTITGSGVTQGFDLLAQSSGSITVAGQYSGVVDFDPLGTPDTRTAQAQWDSFFSHYSASGNVISVQTLDGTFAGGGQASAIESIAETKDGALLTAGHYRLAVDFQPGPGEFRVFPNPGDEIFVARYAPDLIFGDGFQTQP